MYIDWEGKMPGRKVLYNLPALAYGRAPYKAITSRQYAQAAHRAYHSRRTPEENLTQAHNEMMLCVCLNMAVRMTFGDRVGALEELLDDYDPYWPDHAQKLYELVSEMLPKIKDTPLSPQLVTIKLPSLKDMT